MKISLTTPLVMGIEIGGTKTQVGIGRINGKLLSHGVIRKQVAHEHGAAGILNDVIMMSQQLMHRKRIKLSQIKKIGIGFGGILDLNKGVILKSFQVDGWNKFPLKKWAENQWKRPVFVQNDASAAGLAESLHGNGQGYARVFYMTIGSGIGGGWILNGKIDNGQGFGAAEVGHMWVPDPRSGTPTELEQVCSGWSIGRRARLDASVNKNSLMTKLSGSVEKIDARVVYAAAEKNDKAAKQILDETCRTLGIAISNIIALLHPERVILGGGVSLMGPLFWKTLRSQIKDFGLPEFTPQVDVMRAKLRENVVLIGALNLN